MQKSASEIADAIYNTQTFQDTLNAIDADMLGDYYRIDAADLSDSKVYVSGSFSTAEEIAVFQASSSDAVENIKKAIDTRLEDLKLAFENYVPGEMTKINNPVLVTKGTTVVLVLADDTASVSDQINELRNKKERGFLCPLSWVIIVLILAMAVIIMRRGTPRQGVSILPLALVPFGYLIAGPISRWLDGFSLRSVPICSVCLLP